MKSLNAGQLAYDLMAKNPNRWYALGDFLREIRQANGRRLPEGTAIGQRVRERFESDLRVSEQNHTRPFADRVYVEQGRGCIVEVLYKMSKDGARRYFAARAEKVRRAA